MTSAVSASGYRHNTLVRSSVANASVALTKAFHESATSHSLAAPGGLRATRAGGLLPFAPPVQPHVCEQIQPRVSGLGEVLPAWPALLGERLRPLLLIGVTPHRDQLVGAGTARVGEPLLEGAPERPLRRPHGGG